MLEILAIGLMSAPFSLAAYSLLARGLPKIFTVLIGVRVAVTFVLIPLGFYLFGLPGAVWAIALSQLSTLPATIYYQLKFGLFDLAKELQLIPILFAGMLIAKGFTLLIGH
jgi:hypothetical protein